jgi:hypothetical protein
VAGYLHIVLEDAMMCPNAPSAMVSVGIGMIGAIAGSVVGAYVSHRLILLREYRLALGRFHAAFAVVLDSLRMERPNSTAVKDSIAGCEAAIAEFRTYLSSDRRTDYDEASKQYHKSRDGMQNHEAAGGAPDIARKELTETIHNLLAQSEDEASLF